MRLPDILSQAIENEIHEIDPQLLLKAGAELSVGYRSPGAGSPPFISSQAHRIAYVNMRLPATYAAIWSTLREVRARLPEIQLRSLLDLGAGPGTAMWAAAEIITGLEQVTLVERDRELVQLGKRLAQGAGHPALPAAKWLSLNLRDEIELPPHDLIIISYALGELDETARESLVRRAWRAAIHALVIIEPGTPRGFSHILAARSELITLGGSVIAPCPHMSQCPAAANNDWCHFSQRVERTSQHRRAKAGTLSYEDEKFSYLAAAKFPVEPAPARIIRHPLKRMGHIRLDLCTAAGLKRETISKKNKEAYRRARKADWGATWED